MYLILLIFLILLFFIGYLLLENVSVNFLLNTDEGDMHVDLKWPYLLEAKVKMVDTSPFLSIFLFHKRIYAKAMQRKRGSNRKFAKYFPFLNYKDPNAKIFYSFDDPFQTGIANGALDVLNPFMGRASIAQYPDYVPDHAYVVIQADTEVYVRKSIAQLIRNKLNLKK